MTLKSSEKQQDLETLSKNYLGVSQGWQGCQVSSEQEEEMQQEAGSGHLQ